LHDFRDGDTCGRQVTDFAHILACSANNDTRILGTYQRAKRDLRLAILIVLELVFFGAIRLFLEFVINRHKVGRLCFGIRHCLPFGMTVVMIVLLVIRIPFFGFKTRAFGTVDGRGAANVFCI
jgi:hypothetical protein